MIDELEPGKMSSKIYWSPHGGIVRSWPVERLVAKVAEAGYAGIEALVTEQWMDRRDATDAARLKALLDSHELECPAVCWRGNQGNLLFTDPQHYATSRAYLVECIEAASWLGARAVLLWPRIAGGVSRPDALAAAARVLNDVGDLCRRRGVTLSVEFESGGNPLCGTPAATALAMPAPAPELRDLREERVRLSRRRLTIARPLVEAQQTAAMLTTFNEVDMSAVIELRTRRRDAFKERYGVGLGFMSFFTKAAIGALKAFPQINAELQGEELVIKHYYDIGIAVSTDEGLVVPVLRDSDKLTFAEFEQQIAALATKARERRLTLEDLRGGTFTITNGGVFGSLLSTPILNPPQVGILGMHKIEERPVAVGGQVVVRPMMYVALTYDHRVVDGREAVLFLVRVKELIEDPALLLIEG